MKIFLSLTFFALVSCSSTKSSNTPDVHELFKKQYPYRGYYSPLFWGASDTALEQYSNSADDKLDEIYQSELKALSKGPANNEKQRIARIKHIHQRFADKNSQLLKRLATSLRLGDLSQVKKYDRAFVEKLRAQLENHPIVGLQNFEKFDPAYQVGFCFGRATWVHLYLSKTGVPQENLAKIFGFGELNHEGILWKFHMATMLRGFDSLKQKPVWWVIDSLFPRVLEVGEWAREVSRFSIFDELSDVRFYTTPAQKFLPAKGEYQTVDLQIPEYKGFFVDLARDLNKQ